jgi:hypothetical protein
MGDSEEIEREPAVSGSGLAFFYLYDGYDGFYTYILSALGLYCVYLSCPVC